MSNFINTEINKYVINNFYKSLRLKSIVIPNSITFIGAYCITFCSSLESIKSSIQIT